MGDPICEKGQTKKNLPNMLKISLEASTVNYSHSYKATSKKSPWDIYMQYMRGFFFSVENAE